MREVFCKGVAA